MMIQYKKLKNEVYRLVANHMGYEVYFILFREKSEVETFSYFIQCLKEEFSLKFNTNNIWDVLPKYKNKSTYNMLTPSFNNGKAMYWNIIGEIYSTSIKKKDLLLAEALINACVSTILKYNPSNLDAFLNSTNLFCNKIGFHYDFYNKSFYFCDNQSLEEIKMFPLEIKNKYKTSLDIYSESKRLLQNGYYSQSITESLKSLESLVKIILLEKNIEHSTNFSNNIRKLIEIGFFKTFKVQSYFEGLGCIRNNNSGHGKEEPHEEDFIFSSFYHNSIGVALLFIIKTNK